MNCGEETYFKDIVKVVNYLYEDELKDWQEKNYPKKHIYLNLKRIKDYLKRNEK